MANKPKIKNERTHGEKEGEKREKTKHFLKRKRRQVMQIHVIRVHNTTHLAVTTTRQGNRRSRTIPHKETMRGLVKHRD